VSETLSPTGSSGSSGRDASQTRQATNASAIMISDVFMDVFMPPKITADRGGGQATEGALFRQHINCLKSFSAFLSLFLGLLVALNA
jgi:hypothetical protein